MEAFMTLDELIEQLQEIKKDYPFYDRCPVIFDDQVGTEKEIKSVNKSSKHNCILLST
jgi:hypothetical protein